MEPSKEPICVRIARLNNLFLGQLGGANTRVKKHCLGREGLLDALIVLYDECNNDTLKKDKNIASFIEKYRSLVSELRSLRVNITDFEVKKVIGRGHFGEVQVVREKQTGDVYAMKTLRKSDTLSQQAVAFYEEERDIMAHASSPWLTLLQYAFQDMHNLYLVMEFHPGGDLLALLDRFDGLDEHMARFYLAELVLAIRSLHAMGYVHRDIKPDNILIDRCGHLKLADFGSAAKLSAAGVVTSQMPVGTPEYIAPEVLESMEASLNNGKRNRGTYGVECDYWSLGIVAYEMVLGQTPFSGGHMTVTYSNIMNYKATLQFPEDSAISQSYCDMVKALLDDANSRLGHEQLVKHAFFSNINWNTLREDVPPFVPVVNGVDDTSNFEEFEREPPTPSIEDFKTKKEFSGNNLPFVGFTYVQDVEVPSKCKESTGISPKRKSELEDTLMKQKKEIEDFQKKLHQLENGDEGRLKDVEILEKKIELQKQRLETMESDQVNTERECEQLKNERMSLMRTLEQERKDRKAEEMRAVQMIRDSRVKWEKEHKQKVTNLENQVEKQNQRITELCTKNNTLTSFVDRQAEELKSARIEIEMLQSMVQISKCHEMNRRNSVVGVENKLERINAESQRQVAALLAQLDEEAKLRTGLEEQLRGYETDAAQREIEFSSLKIQTQAETSRLKVELESNQQECIRMRQQIDILHKQAEECTKSQENMSKIHIANLEENLRREKEECRELRMRLTNLEGELSDSLISHENTLTAKETEHEVQVTLLEKELKQVSAEKMKLCQRLQEAREKEEEDSRKLESLEALLHRLEQGVARLEEENLKLKGKSELEDSNKNNSDLVEKLEQQRLILVAQVEKLESQVEKVREVSVLDRQAAKTAQEQLWKKEKELSDTKIDLRIARRETKTAEDQLKQLQEEKQKWSEKLLVEKNAQDQQLSEERKKADQIQQQLAVLKAEFEEVNRREEAAKKQIDVEKGLLAQKKMEIESSKSTVQKLQHDVDMAQKQIRNLDQQISNLQLENKCLNDTVNNLRGDKVKQGACLEDYKRKVSSLELNYENLKEVCTENDDQLEYLGKLTATHEEKIVTLNKERESLHFQIESLQSDLREASQNKNEEKSLRIRAELRIQSLETELQTYADDITVLQSQVADYRSLVEERTQQVTELEDRCCAAELDLRNTRRQLEASKEECSALKEEITQQLTQINSVKDSNYKLTRDLEDSNEQIEQLKLRYADLEASLSELEVDFKSREYKNGATIQQQTKLIDYLQTKVEDGSKKKKTLKDKLFNRRQKENISYLANIPPGKCNQLYQQSKSKAFTEQLAHQKTSHKVADSGGISPAIAATPVTPLSKTALTHLVQSPGSQTPNSFARQPSLQRMHHNIPHRFEPKLCMRAIKCAACLDSIHFGHYASTCQECGITSHPKCSLVLPSTCGIPSGFTRHFSQRWKSSQVDSADTTISSETSERNSESSRMEGHVKIPKRGRSCWERKYLRLDGAELQIFDQEPTSETVSPSKTFLVCRPEGTTSILSSVPYSEVVNTAKSDLPFIFKVEVSSRTTCWPGSTLLIMALSFSDKQSWVSALEALVQRHNSVRMDAGSGQSIRYQGNTLLRLERTEGLELNCCLQLSPQIILLGAEEGLFSFRLQEKNAKPVKIHGLTHVHQMSAVPMLNCLIVLAGENRNLMQCDLRQVRISAEAAECVQPSVSVKPILPTSDTIGCCLVFAATTTKDKQDQPRTIVCVAVEKRILLLRWSASQNTFQLKKVIDTEESCSFIHFARHSIIVACNKFFEIDIHDFSIEEFLDASDKSLAAAVFGVQQLHIYPVAVLDVTKSTATEPEFLLCFNVFGVFVNKFGQRTRSEDIKWSYLPLGFAYRKPYLFIIHFASVEVMKLSESSFTRNQDESNSTVNHPEQTFIGLNNPRYLGPIEGQGPAIYVGHCTQNNVELLMVEGMLACRDESFSVASDTGSERDGADLNSYEGSEFSFTSSLVQSVENVTDSSHSLDNEPIDMVNQHRKVHFDGVR